VSGRVERELLVIWTIWAAETGQLENHGDDSSGLQCLWTICFNVGERVYNKNGSRPVLDALYRS
jgi:hypothetical protein